MLFSICYFMDKQGVKYSDDKTQLISTPTTLDNYVVIPECTTITGGEEKTSSFYPCKNVIQTVSFAENSRLSSIAAKVFTNCTIRSIDFSNCKELLSISEYCFRESMLLHTVTFPPNIKEIGKFAFQWCRSIESISFPNSLEKIGSSAFRSNSLLKIVNIQPETNIKVLESEAFSETKIGSFYIGEFLSNIGSYAFSRTQITSFDINPNNKIFTVANHCLLLNNTIQVSSEIAFTGTVEVPSTVTTIRGFRGVKHSKIIIPTSVTTPVNGWCFAESSFTEIEWPSSLTTIPADCFYSCSALSIVSLPDNLEVIEERAFIYCVSLKNIEIPPSVTKIGGGAFTGTTGLVVDSSRNENILIKDDIIYSDKKTTLVEYFGTKTSITVHDFCTVIGPNALQGKKIHEITFLSAPSLTIKQNAFLGSALQIVEFPATLISIDNSAFEKCTSLHTVTFNSQCTITRINKNTFKFCSSLSSITLPPGLKSIGVSAFAFCTSLTVLDIPHSVNDFQESCFEGTAIQQVSITAQEKITMGYSVLKQSKVETLKISAPEFTEIPLETCFSCECLTQVSLPETTTTIGSTAFAHCIKLEHFTLPRDIQTIKARAFLNCSILKTVKFPLNSNLTTIEEQIFFDCPALDNLIVDENDKTLLFKDNALMNREMTKIVLYLPSSKNRIYIVHESVKEILAYAFNSCYNLKILIIPDGKLDYIGIYAFANCKNLELMHLSNCIKTIANNAFDNCYNLKCGSVIAPESIIDQAVAAGIKREAFNKDCPKFSCAYLKPVNNNFFFALIFFALNA